MKQPEQTEVNWKHAKIPADLFYILKEQTKKNGTKLIFQEVTADALRTGMKRKGWLPK